MSSQINPSVFSDGEPVSKSALRDTFSTIKSELEHGGFTQIAPDAPMRRVSDRLGDMISVKDFGAIGDGNTDDSGALQAAIDTGRAIYLPAGRYRTNTALTYSASKPLILIGEFFRLGADATSEILDGRGAANNDEPLIHREEGWLDSNNVFTDGAAGTPTFASGNSVILKDLYVSLNSANLLGQCLDVQGTRYVHLNHCRFAFGMRGVTLGNSVFDNNIHGCQFTSSFFTKNNHTWADDKQKARRSWGLYASGHTYIFGCEAKGVGTAFYLNGIGTNFSGCRAENCGYGMILGDVRFRTTGPEGWALSRSVISGLSFEACAISLEVVAVNATQITGVGIQGSPADLNVGRPFDGEIGLLVNGLGETSTISNVSVGGIFTTAATINNSSRPIWAGRGNNTTNAVVAGQIRPLNTVSAGGSRYHFLNTEMFPAAADSRHRTMTAFHDLMLPGLTGLNIKDMAASGSASGGPVFSKNLGGTVVPANAASKATVAFARTVQANNINFSADPTLVSDVTSALAPGTYYYATTVVGPHGETSTNAGSVKTVVVGVGEKVSMTFFNTGENVSRRVYRGTKAGVYDGYWISGALTSFVDAGQAFSGKGSPPAAGNIPARAEDDTKYQIVATPSWATTVHVTDKTTTEFTLNFGTPAPDANQSVAWLMFRP